MQKRKQRTQTMVARELYNALTSKTPNSLAARIKYHVHTQIVDLHGIEPIGEPRTDVGFGGKLQLNMYERYTIHLMYDNCTAAVDIYPEAVGKLGFIGDLVLLVCLQLNDPEAQRRRVEVVMREQYQLARMQHEELQRLAALGR